MGDHHDSDGWQSYVPWLNLILMNGFVKPGTLKVSYIKLLRDERPCRDDHGDCRALVGLACRSCGAVI